MDSGFYKDNRKIYDDTLLHRIKGVITFKGNQSKFYVDSTYFFAVTLNVYYNYNDIETYPSKELGKNYKIDRVQLPMDSFCFLLTPLKRSKSKFELALSQRNIHNLNRQWYGFADKTIDITDK